MSANTKVAVITGASHGLGEAIASQLAGQGLDLALIARGKERLEAVAARLRLTPHGAAGKIAALTCDVSDRSQVEGIVGRILAEHGRVDVLVNNAGIPAPRTLDDTGLADWDEVIATNLSGAFYMTRALWGALTRERHRLCDQHLGDQRVARQRQPGLHQRQIRPGGADARDRSVGQTV